MKRASSKGRVQREFGHAESGGMRCYELCSVRTFASFARKPIAMGCLCAMMLPARPTASRKTRILQGNSQRQNKSAQNRCNRQVCEEPPHAVESTPLDNIDAQLAETFPPAFLVLMF